MQDSKKDTDVYNGLLDSEGEGGALAINEQISYAAHVAVVEQRSPHLGGEDEASLIFWQAPQVQLIIQVQNLTLARSGVRRAQCVDRNGTWCKDKP